MKPSQLFCVAVTGAALAASAASAGATTMHSTFGARLSGMGEHGVVNLAIHSGKICWTFDVPASVGATTAAVHSGGRGATLFELGMHYAKSGCASEDAMTLQHLETKPASYSVWVNTKAHPGELRGALTPGMARM